MRRYNAARQNYGVVPVWRLYSDRNISILAVLLWRGGDQAANG